MRQCTEPVLVWGSAVDCDADPALSGNLVGAEVYRVASRTVCLMGFVCTKSKWHLKHFKIAHLLEKRH